MEGPSGLGPGMVLCFENNECSKGAMLQTVQGSKSLREAQQPWANFHWIMEDQGLAASGAKMPQSKAFDSLSSGIESGLNPSSNKLAPGVLEPSSAGVVSHKLTGQIQPAFVNVVTETQPHTSFLCCLLLL